jgi:DNA repair exonuclease SbcCD ATPase subunit
VKVSDFMRLPITIFGILFLLAQPSFSGNVYRWTDEKGTVHFTDEISKVPGQYLDHVKKSEFPEESLIEKEKQVVPKKDESNDRVKRYLDEIDKKIKAKKELEKIISKLEEELKESEDRLREIEKFEKENFNYYQPIKDRNTGKFVPVGSPYYEEKKRRVARIEEIKNELEPLEEKLSEINRSL